MTEKRTIGIFGQGKWGLALTSHLHQLGHEVIGWSRTAPRRDLVEPQWTVTSSLEEMEHLRYFVYALPSSAVDAIAPILSTLSPETIIVSAAKGLTDDALTPLQKIESYAPHLTRTAAISGPLFAHELVEGRPASLVMASKIEEVAIEAAHMFEGRHLRLYLSHDSWGVELGGIFKNVIALAVGVSDGLELGDAARAALLVHGMAEMTELAVALGARRASLYGLSGMGDLIMTATCDTSRNRRVGKLLGQRKTLAQALEEVGETAEGVRASRHVLELAKKVNMEVPISAGLVELMDGKGDPQPFLTALLEGPAKWETQEQPSQ